jgi:hypothetical protein
LDLVDSSGACEGLKGAIVGEAAIGAWVRLYGAGSGAAGIPVGSITKGVGDRNVGDIVATGTSEVAHEMVGTSVPESGIGVFSIWVGAAAGGEGAAGALVRVAFKSICQSAGGGVEVMGLAVVGLAVVGLAVTGANDEVKEKSAVEAAQNPKGLPLMMKQFSE